MSLFRGIGQQVEKFFQQVAGRIRRPPSEQDVKIETVVQKAFTEMTRKELLDVQIPQEQLEDLKEHHPKTYLEYWLARYEKRAKDHGDPPMTDRELVERSILKDVLLPLMGIDTGNKEEVVEEISPLNPPRENSLPREVIRILIVDDNHLLQKYIQTAFLEYGFENSQIETAKNGEEALEKIKKGNYHIITMDNNMPPSEEKGYQTILKIREWENREGKSHAAILFHTSEPFPTLPEGADALIPKPITTQYRSLKIFILKNWPEK